MTQIRRAENRDRDDERPSITMSCLSTKKSQGVQKVRRIKGKTRKAPGIPTDKDREGNNWLTMRAASPDIRHGSFN